MTTFWNAFLEREETVIASTGVAYSISWKQGFQHGCEYGLEIQLEATGTPNVQVDLELSNEGADDTQTANTDYVVADGDTAIITVNDSLVHIKGFNPTPAGHARLKLTGLSGNPADTSIVRARIIRTK